MRAARWSLFVAAGLTVLAACSGDDSSSDTLDSLGATDAPSASDPDAPVTLTLAALRPAAGLVDELAGAQQQAWELAVEDINDAGGILGGRVEVVTVDEVAGDPEATIAAATEAGADALLGPVTSAVAADLIPALTDTGLVTCSASATAPNLTIDDADGVFVRTVLPDQFTVDEATRAVLRRRDDAQLPEGTTYRVTIVARDDDYGASIAQGLSASLEANGMAATTIDYPEDAVTFADVAREVASTERDLVVLIALEEAPRLISDLLAAGVAADRMLGVEGSLVPRIAEQVSAGDPAAIDGFQVVAATGGFDFIKRMVDAGANQVLYGPQMYDCVASIALAVQASESVEPGDWIPLLANVTGGTGVTCSTIADCLGKLAAGETIDYDGPSGPIAFDERGDVGGARYTIAEVVEGELRAVESIEVDLADQAAAAALGSAVFTASLQRDLQLLGLYDGEITGVYDEATAAAVAALQQRLGLPVTGVYDEATDAALVAAVGESRSSVRTSTKQLQQSLTALGFYSGPIDGVYNQATANAVRAFQTSLGVPPTGVVDVATMQAIYAAGFASGAASVPPPTVPPTTVAPTTVPPPTTAPPSSTLSQVLASNADLSTFGDLVTAAGLGDLLAAPGSLTVFAPTNEAFAALPDGVLDGLRADPEALAGLLRAHIGSGSYAVAQLPTAVVNLEGGLLSITGTGGAVAVNGAPIVLPDLRASNGYVQGIGQVLLADE